MFSLGRVLDMEMLNLKKPWLNPSSRRLPHILALIGCDLHSFITFDPIDKKATFYLVWNLEPGTFMTSPGRTIVSYQGQIPDNPGHIWQPWDLPFLTTGSTGLCWGSCLAPFTISSFFWNKTTLKIWKVQWNKTSKMSRKTSLKTS